MSQRNLAILLWTILISYVCHVRGGQTPYTRYVGSGLATIEDSSLEPVESRELFDGAMRGMVDVLLRHGDEHSQYLNEAEAAPLRSEIRQQFGGIGVRIRMEGDPAKLLIAGPPDPGTPAARANLLPDDHIQAIDGYPTAGMDVIEVLNHMRGEAGTVVRLTIQHAHENSPRTVELTREIIRISSILGDRVDHQGKWQYRLADEPSIAHVRITLFGDRTAEELGAVMEQLTVAGVEGMVLDLRDNAGGVLDAAVAVCDMFLPAQRTIVETRGKNGTLRKRYESTGGGKYLDLPLAIIVNQNSASAAEIVAACLQDHHRAVIVGERSYGKGTVQQVIPLAGNSLLKLTWASFWRPSGVDLHRKIGAPADGTWGVTPDAGYQRQFTREEYAAYREYRSRRDSQREPTELTSNDEQTGASQAADFVDEQLVLSVDALHKKP